MRLFLDANVFFLTTEPFAESGLEERVSIEIIYALYKNDYKSKLSSLSKKSKRPIVSIPSSFRRGMM